MADQSAKGEGFAQKAEKKLSGWGLFRSKYDDATDLFEKAAICFKLAKKWDRAGSVYIKIAVCQLKLDSKHEAASSYVDAANCYKKISIQDAAQSLNEAVNLFLEIGRLCMAARYCKELGELYEQEQDLENAIMYFERAADLFQCEEVTTSAYLCNQKVAQFVTQLEQYPKAIEIFEGIARQSINNNLLKYGVKGVLLNSGICQLCKGDVVAVTNALERYEELDPTFSGTREFKLLSRKATTTGNDKIPPNVINIESYLAMMTDLGNLIIVPECPTDLAEALDEEDVVKFTDAVQEYDSMTRLDAWKTTLLLRVKNTIKLKEEEEDDLT